MSCVVWSDTKTGHPAEDYIGKDILVVDEESNVQCIRWDGDLDGLKNFHRWAFMPRWKPNTEIVLNQSFGRFVISKACREELGIATDPKDPRYISDAEIRQDWRYDKRLIAAVKKLGFLANGPGAHLVVVELPGCYYIPDIIISERNGYETIDTMGFDRMGGA